MVCTCKKCIGGVLSPRGAESLKEVAISSAELVMDSMPAFPDDTTAIHDPDFYLSNYLTPDLRMEVEKKFVIGFANYMKTVAYLLGQGQLPKPSMVAMCSGIGVEDPGSSKIFAAKGGLAEYALDALISICEDKPVEESSGHPSCANDSKWEIVRQTLFVNSTFWPCGPYLMLDEGDDGDDDGWVYYDT